MEIEVALNDIGGRAMTAGVDHPAACGPTMIAIAEAATNEVRTPRSAVGPTNERLGYQPMSLGEGLRLLIPWLRARGKL